MILTIVLIVSIAALTIASPFPPLQDYPEWTYQGYIFSELLKGSAAISSRFHVLPYPVPNSTAQLVLGLLTYVLTPIQSAKALIVLYCIAVVLLALRLASHLPADRRSLYIWVIVFLIGFDGSFWSGYINFQFALILLALYVSLITQPRERSRWIHVGFSIAIFFTHFVVLFTFVLIYCSAYLLPSVSRPLLMTARGSLKNLVSLRSLALAPVLLLSIWYVFGRLLTPDAIFVDTPPDKEIGGSLFAFGLYKAYTLMKLGPFQAFELPTGGPLVPSHKMVYFVGIGANLAFAAALAGHLYHALSARKLSCGNVPSFPNAKVVQIVIFAMFVVSPQLFAGVVNIGERLIITAFLIALIVAPPPRSISWVYAMTSLACAPLYLWLLASYGPPHQIYSQLDGDWAPRYFTHRPYEFEGLIEFLKRPTPETAPELSFSTSFLSQVP
jgi:hypothetical protein